MSWIPSQDQTKLSILTKEGKQKAICSSCICRAHSKCTPCQMTQVLLPLHVSSESCQIVDLRSVLLGFMWYGALSCSPKTTMAEWGWIVIIINKCSRFRQMLLWLAPSGWTGVLFSAQCDPYIKISLGRNSIDDRDHYLPNTTNPVFGR